MLVCSIKIFLVRRIFLYTLVTSHLYILPGLFNAGQGHLYLFYFFHVNSAVAPSMCPCAQKILSTSHQFMEVTSLRPSSKLSFFKLAFISLFLSIHVPQCLLNLHVLCIFSGIYLFCKDGEWYACLPGPVTKSTEMSQCRCHHLMTGKENWLDQSLASILVLDWRIITWGEKKSNREKTSCFTGSQWRCWGKDCYIHLCVF